MLRALAGESFPTLVTLVVSSTFKGRAPLNPRTPSPTPVSAPGGSPSNVPRQVESRIPDAGELPIQDTQNLSNGECR